MTTLFISMRNKPLHKWQYKGKHHEYEGKAPEDVKDPFNDVFECSRCGFALVSYTSGSPSQHIQHLISHNSQLLTCEPNKEA